MVSRVELYEALKGALEPKAAQMLVDSLRDDSGLATKEDIQMLRDATREDLQLFRDATREDLQLFRDTTKEDLQLFRDATREDLHAIHVEIERLHGALSATEARLMRWMLGFFVPLWLGVAGMVVSLLLRG